MPIIREIRIRLALLVGVVFLGALATLAYLLFAAPTRVQLVEPAADASRISFFALGDQGSGGLKQWEIARGMERVAERAGAPDFVALLGDNFYSHGVRSTRDKRWNWKFENVYIGNKLVNIPFYAVLGNHDVEGNAEAQIQYSRKHAGSGRWQMPGHSYSKDFGMDSGHPLLRVVFIDTNDPTREKMAKQARFMEEAFSPSAQQPTWRIVVGHHPFRNFGKHGEAPELVSALLPVLQKLQVDLYLAGHDHDQQLIVRDGEPVYVISGGGGQSLYGVAKEQPGLLFSRSQHGFAKIVVDSSRMLVDFYDGHARMAAEYAVERSCTKSASACLQPTVAPKSNGR